MNFKDNIVLYSAIAIGILVFAAMALSGKDKKFDKERTYSKNEGPPPELQDELINLAESIYEDLNKSWWAWMGELGHEIELYEKALKLDDKNFAFMVSYADKYITKSGKSLCQLASEQSWTDDSGGQFVARAKRLTNSKCK